MKNAPAPTSKLAVAALLVSALSLSLSTFVAYRNTIYYRDELQASPATVAHEPGLLTTSVILSNKGTRDATVSAARIAGWCVIENTWGWLVYDEPSDARFIPKVIKAGTTDVLQIKSRFNGSRDCVTSPAPNLRIPLSDILYWRMHLAVELESLDGSGSIFGIMHYLSEVDLSQPAPASREFVDTDITYFRTNTKPFSMFQSVLEVPPFVMESREAQ